METKNLELQGVIAFDGTARNSLRLHPDGEHLIYPMGNKVVVKNATTHEQVFLAGHQNFVSAVCVSPCGNFIASGQANHHGFKAMVILWDYAKRRIKVSYEIHKVRVEDVCFTRDSDYLVSLGGRDDGNIVVWDVRRGDPLCGLFAGNETGGNAHTIARANVYPWGFVTAGDRTLKVWRISPQSRKVYGSEVKVGKIRRSINCVVVDGKDENAYCGTSSGDIIKARLNFHEIEQSINSSVMVGCYSKVPSRFANKTNSCKGDLYAGGVKYLLLLQDGRMIVGTGDGTVELIEISSVIGPVANEKSKKLLIRPQIVTSLTGTVCAAVTSMTLYKKDFVLVGTVQCEVYEIHMSSFRKRLLVSSHTSSVYDVAFPPNRSDVFATAGEHDIRLWTLETQRELLRISVPNFICSSLCFDREGRSIISVWNDGAMRGFALNSDGKLIFEIQNAHAKGVSAVTITNDDAKFVTGGCDGQVRIWEARSKARRLLNILKGHRGPVTSLRISRDDKSLISSSTDGTCIIWDVTNFTRKHVLMGNTMYMGACFSPTGVQILTCGTDRNVAYWETWDGSLIREVESSTVGTLNCVDVSPDGRYFCTGSNDFTARLWDYRTGTCVRVGLAHAAAITACKFAPNNTCIVTVSADGAIMIWGYLCGTAAVDRPETINVQSRDRDSESADACLC